MAQNDGKVADGYYSTGNIRYSLKNKEILDISIKTFNKYSNYRNNVEYLNYFLLCLEITSTLEGGFDAINTYDNAGLTIGFVQFADPSPQGGKAYKLLKAIDVNLLNEVNRNYGDKKPYTDAISLKGRLNKDLLDRIQSKIISPLGIEQQLKLAIEDFYDPAFAKFLTFKFSEEIDDDPKNFGSSYSVKNVNNYKSYAMAMLFDTAINRGKGVLSKFKQINKGNKPMTEGDFLYYHIYKEQIPSSFRVEYWKNVINKNFKKAKITG